MLTVLNTAEAERNTDLLFCSVLKIAVPRNRVPMPWMRRLLMVSCGNVSRSAAERSCGVVVDERYASSYLNKI